VLNTTLASAYESRGSGEMLPALILLSNRPDAAKLAEDMQQQGRTLSDVHTRIAQSLQAAAADQSAVLKSLDILKSTGMASDVRSLWIVNVIAARLTRPAAELIANMTEVETVGLDEPVVVHSLFDITPLGSAARSEEGLARMAVPDVWQMGFRGEGRTVCVLADGAASIPSLNTRWRGQVSPAAECWFSLSAGEAVSACGDVGTAMIGALCGAEANGETYGVAPDARWISARVLCDNSRLSHVLIALQWAADPDGDPSTFNDVPDAICGAWGLNAGCGGGTPDGVWDAVANVEALGPLLIFPAHQEERAGSASIRLPESLARCLAVGNADVSGALPSLHPSSGRGPSPCDPTLVKPDVCAPGTWVRTLTSAGPVQASGTPLSAARVAGVAALLRQASPNAPASEIKRVLAVTATDLGGPGPDNAFGFGMIHAARALTMMLSSGRMGAVQGTITCGSEPVFGARVVLAGPFGEALTTSQNGFFGFDQVAAGRRYALRIGRFGYRMYFHPDSIAVETGRTTNLSISLERGFDDDAEYDQGWSLGVEGDNATGGIWARAVPVGSRVDGKLVQPDEDASPLGNRCFVTGNAPSPTSDARDNDVDGGKTTLRSPLFSLLGLESPVVKFSYWFSNDRGSNPGSDFFRAQISSDGGATWLNLINTAASTNGWSTVRVRINDFVASTDRMMLQFVTEDAGPGSLVEAAVDDLSITGPPPELEAPRDLMLDVRADHVRLVWRPSVGAAFYRVYLSGSADRVVAPQNLYTTTSDTTVTVPMSDIRFDEFFFQVTASK